jgi:hypothetical protein
MTLIIYYILVLIVILKQSRMLEKRWKKAMGMEV